MFQAVPILLQSFVGLASGRASGHKILLQKTMSKIRSVVVGSERGGGG